MRNTGNRQSIEGQAAGLNARADPRPMPAKGVGSSNTRPRVKFDTPHVFEVGVDTWRLNFKVSRDHGAEVFDLGRDKAQWMPGLSLLCVEGHPSPDGLAHACELSPAFEEVCRLVEENCGSYDFKGLARLDSTATMRFEDHRQGVAVLQGIAALDFPRLKQVVYAKPPETVALMALNSRGRILGRCYDKGIEARTHERGELIRFEDQSRFKSGARPSQEVFTARYVQERFERRFLPLAKATKGLTVASLPVLTRKLQEQLIEGEISPAKAERLAGYLIMGGGGMSRSSNLRRRAELRTLGLVEADAFFEPVEVNLGEVFEACLSSERWGA